MLLCCLRAQDAYNDKNSALFAGVVLSHLDNRFAIVVFAFPRFALQSSCASVHHLLRLLLHVPLLASATARCCCAVVGRIRLLTAHSIPDLCSCAHTVCRC